MLIHLTLIISPYSFSLENVQVYPNLSKNILYYKRTNKDCILYIIYNSKFYLFFTNCKVDKNTAIK